MKRTCLILLLIACCVPALAIGKVTTDPNAGGSAAAPAEMLDDSDARLSKPVTINDSRIQVWKIMDELTKTSGVVFKAGSGSYDWQVRDRKMNVFAKDIPLVQLMNSIAHVMKFKWERKGDSGKWTYRLYMDRRTLLDAEAQRARAEEKQKNQEIARRKNALDTYGKLGSMTEAERAKLRQDSPFLYAVGKTGWGDALGAFFQQVPAVADALASGQKITLDGASLTPAGRTSMVNAMKAEMLMEQRFSGGHGVNKTLPENLDPSKVMLLINDNFENAPAAILGVFLGEMKFKTDDDTISTPFINPESNLAKWIGKILIEADQTGRSADDVMKDHQSEAVSLFTSEAKAEFGGEPEIEHPDDPALLAKVKLAPQSNALWNVEMDISTASNYAIVSDCFTTPNWGGIPDGGPVRGETELKAALQRIGDIYIYNWDKSGSVLEFRDRNWFRKRALQIPDAWLEKWRGELQKTGTIDIDSLAQVAQLTQEQINANIPGDDVLNYSSLSSTVASSRELLRFYASLTSDQRATLSNGPGLDLLSLSPDQTDQLAKLLGTRSATQLGRDAAPVMRCERVQSGSFFFYTFKLTAGKMLTTTWLLDSVQPYDQPVPPKPRPAAPPAAAKQNDTQKPESPAPQSTK